MGAVNGPLDVGAKSVGDSGSLFLYYSTNGPNESDIDIGAFMDIATSRPGVILQNALLYLAVRLVAALSLAGLS